LSDTRCLSSTMVDGRRITTRLLIAPC
jgi:hypothetical protein